MVLLLSTAALRCWAGPTAAGLEYNPPLSSGLHAALEVPLILASAAADISGSMQQRTSRTLVTIATAAAGSNIGGFSRCAVAAVLLRCIDSTAAAPAAAG